MMLGTRDTKKNDFVFSQRAYSYIAGRVMKNQDAKMTDVWDKQWEF